MNREHLCIGSFRKTPVLTDAHHKEKDKKKDEAKKERGQSYKRLLARNNNRALSSLKSKKI